MDSLVKLIDQVRTILIETEGKAEKHEIFNRFINESKACGLSEENFYKLVLKPAFKSVDWDDVEEQIKNKEESQEKSSESLYIEPIFFCANCGLKKEESWKFCENCGYEF